MDVYMVIKVLTTIVGVAGPLPYDLQECKESLNVLDQSTKYKFECIESNTKPVIETRGEYNVEEKALS